MIPLILIIAMVLEPIGPITDPPFQYGIDELETIDVIPLEVLERKLKKQQLRIMNLDPENME